MSKNRTTLQNLRTAVTPIQAVAVGYLLLTLIVTFLLMLPSATTPPGGQAFTDAFFVSASAISTTGLATVDVGQTYTLFGEIILLIAFQIGGLGYMTFIIFVVSLLGGRLSFHSYSMMKESLATPDIMDFRQFIVSVIKFTIVFEIGGAIAFTFIFAADYPILQAAYLAVFHAVSTFCTAGFSLFPDSFISYQNNIPLWLTVNILSTAGGIGFIVLGELQDYAQCWWHGKFPRRMSTHGKLALILTVFFYGIGTLILFINNQGFEEASIGKRFLISSFQVISASSTTGYSTLNLATLSRFARFMLVILMFIGASAGGTGGGIKAPTVAVIFLAIWAMARGHSNVHIFGRRLTTTTIIQALGVGFLATIWLVMTILIMIASENADLHDIIFEAASALGTVGLSTGLTSQLSFTGKMILSFSMLIGRVGPLAIGFSLLGSTTKTAVNYPVEDVIVG